MEAAFIRSAYSSKSRICPEKLSQVRRMLVHQGNCFGQALGFGVTHLAANPAGQNDDAVEDIAGIVEDVVGFNSASRYWASDECFVATPIARTL
jgi:hypothetical protein